MSAKEVKIKSNQIYWLVGIICLLATLLVLKIIVRPLSQDEGVFLTIGQNIAKGYSPYKDFFDHKPPGIYFLFAFSYYFFGNNLVGYQFILITTLAATGWLVFIAAKKLGANSYLAVINLICLNYNFHVYYQNLEYCIFIILMIDVDV